MITSAYLTESNSFGAFIDYLELYAPFAPNTADQFLAFNPLTSAGVGAYVIDTNVVESALNVIQFNIYYELYPCADANLCAPVQTGLTLLDGNGNLPQGNYRWPNPSRLKFRNPPRER